MRDVPVSLSGAASSTYNFTRQIGGALGAAGGIAVATSPLGRSLSDAISSRRPGVELPLAAAVMVTGFCTAAAAFAGEDGDDEPRPEAPAPAGQDADLECEALLGEP